MSNKKKLKIQPNLFVIGAMRAGSTSLHMLLGQHPEIHMSPVKEPMFYVAETMRRDLVKVGSDPKTIAELNAFVKDRKHAHAVTYEELFKAARKQRYLGESSHYIYHPQVAHVIREDCPDAKIVVILRNPVQRLYSEYLFSRRLGNVDKTFEDYVREQCFFDKTGRQVRMVGRINKGLYYSSLRVWVNVFGSQSVKIILFEDFIRNYVKVCHEIFLWLGIDTSFIPAPIHAQRGGIPKSAKLLKFPDNLKRANPHLKKLLPKYVRVRLRAFWYQLVLKKKDEIDPKTIEFLKEIYRDDVKNLENEFYLDLNAWK